MRRGTARRLQAPCLRVRNLRPATECGRLFVILSKEDGMTGRRWWWLVPVAALGAVLAARGAAVKAAAAPEKTPWKIVGQLEEACRCNAACPCWFNSKPTHMNCGGGQILFIEKGTYGNV